MRWSLQHLNVAKRESFHFDEVVEIPELKDRNKEIRDASSFQVKGKVDYSNSVYTFTIHIVGNLTLPCSRTLADVVYPIDLHVTERYHPADEYMTERFAEENDIHLFEGGFIDLRPAIIERILLEVPMQVFAEDHVEGEAPQSGKGWTVISDEEKTEKVDPRLAGLADFFNKENE